MKIKKLCKTQYEIITKTDQIYITKEKNPGYNYRGLYLYFIDVFSNTNASIIPTDVEVFNELYLAKDYIQDNYNIPDNIIKKITFYMAYT